MTTSTKKYIPEVPFPLQDSDLIRKTRCSKGPDGMKKCSPTEFVSTGRSNSEKRPDTAGLTMPFGMPPGI
jgi:hypothetical protein